jgi:acetyl esterase/lipase
VARPQYDQVRAVGNVVGTITAHGPHMRFHTLLFTLVMSASAHAEKPKMERVWQPPEGLAQTPLWPGAAPDTPRGALPAEKVEVGELPDAGSAEAAWDVTVPTMNTGAAVLVFPGGGFRLVAMALEGTEVCDWITSHGMTCVLVKYRVPGTNHSWDPSCKCTINPKVPRAMQDAQRAIKLVRSRASELKIDPQRIGVMGFSAGGYLVAQTSNIFTATYKPADAIDHVSSRPDFAIAFFPGHLCRDGNTFDPAIHVTKQTPPTFLLQAWDDPVDEICNSTMYARALDDAGVPAEVHLFATGGHAFALRGDSHIVKAWPPLLEAWLRQLNVIPQ